MQQRLKLNNKVALVTGGAMAAKPGCPSYASLQMLADLLQCMWHLGATEEALNMHHICPGRTSLQKPV